MKTNKTELNQRFKRLYKGCTLHSILLNGFTHTVYYKDADGNRHHDYMSAYAPEQYHDDEIACYNDNGTVTYRSFNKDRTKVLFLGFPHYAYQNNAKEYVYKDIKEW